MVAKAARQGTIKTFFSYKGGVGRTMAVANVGFLAALAGKRVLLMDWDLEAPGLAVYFRGVTEHAAASEIRKAPGVLDLFVEWQEKLGGAAGRQGVTATIEQFRSGAPFAKCVRSLIAARHLPRGAKLDHIGAGAPLVGEGDPLPYAEALSRFNWSEFFTDYAGGAMLEALTSWARKNYDLILVDSRTGLADVAGICTMQLPDEAVLCFVLNRQNTEGVAGIAASIIASRGDDVAIRLAPMRVSKERPAEEADARARARREMRNAGLDPDAIDRDMASLSVGTASNVPFYETLAPFAATSSSADPLTFDYLRLTQELVDRKVEVPTLDPAWIESVRRRLQPRMTTVEYLETLESADPDRAFAELERYVEGALDADPTLELDREYVETLVEMAMGAGDWMWPDTAPAGIRDLAEKAVLLLNQLHRMGDDDWRTSLVEAMDELDRRWPTKSRRGSSGAIAERDAILADGPQTVTITAQRAWLRANTAVALNRAGKRDEAENAFASAFDLLDHFSGPLQEDATLHLQVTQAEILAERARLQTRREPDHRSFELWAEVLYKAQKIDSMRGSRLCAEAYFNLAMQTVDGELAIKQIIESAKLWPSYITGDGGRLIAAIDVVLASADPRRHSTRFADAAFGATRARVPALRLSTRTETAPLHDVLEHLTLLVVTMGSGGRHARAIDGIALMAKRQLLRQISLTTSRAREDAMYAALFDDFYSLLTALLASGANEAVIEEMNDRLQKLRNGMRLS